MGYRCRFGLVTIGEDSDMAKFIKVTAASNLGSDDHYINVDNILWFKKQEPHTTFVQLMDKESLQVLLPAEEFAGRILA